MWVYLGPQCPQLGLTGLDFGPETSSVGLARCLESHQQVVHRHCQQVEQGAGRDQKPKLTAKAFLGPGEETASTKYSCQSHRSGGP